MKQKLVHHHNPFNFPSVVFLESSAPCPMVQLCAKTTALACSVITELSDKRTEFWKRKKDENTEEELGEDPALRHAGG